MNALERAVGALTRFLEERRVPYMLIGGIANLVWGEPRATLDVDASVLVEATAWPALISALRRRFRVIPKQPLAFLRDTHVLPVETEDGVRIDLVWATLPYEHKAIARATVEDVAGHRVRVCRPEDLIIHKIVSERAKDREDVRAIVRHQGPRLDRAYLTRSIRSLSKALDQPELSTFLHACFRESAV
ncbi:MAG: nucleotidyltransferase [Candidatus Omnitrophica bacterium]|nr:nucleotidyltransferase [Candidatus Omnitrophota bacterium]